MSRNAGDMRLSISPSHFPPASLKRPESPRAPATFPALVLASGGMDTRFYLGEATADRSLYD